MGLTREKRERMASLGDTDDTVLASLGSHDINFEKFNEQLIYDKINRRLDKQQEKINNK